MMDATTNAPSGLSSAAIRLHANESPYALPINVAEQLRAELAGMDLNRYPEQLADACYQALSQQTGLPRPWLMLGNGSDELILLLLLTFRSRGTLYLPTPTFSMYAHVAEQIGLPVQEFPLTDDFELDLDAMLPVLQSQPGILVICNPNNPTGNCFRHADILRLLQLPEQLVVIDEAYSDFCGRNLQGELAQHPQLLILRTLSKAYGLAGIRFGYLIGHPELLKLVERVRLPYNVNVFSLTAARIALQGSEQVLARLPELIAERQWLAAELAALPGVTVYPSETNFMLASLPVDAEPICQRLLQCGLQVRHFPGRLQRFLRISVGQRREHQLLLQAMSESLRQCSEC